MTSTISPPRGSNAYAAHLASLLPSGPAWAVAPGGTLEGLLLGIGTELARIDGRGIDLIEEADPRTAYELLYDWERVAALPDACVGVGDNARERQTAVHQKITSIGGQSAAYFIDLATKAGFAVEIEEHRPCHVGMPCDAAICDEDWAFVWTVHVLPPDGWFDPSIAIAAAEIGDPVDVRLRGWGSLDLERVIARARPAHTLVLFAYDIEPEPSFWIDFTS